MSAFRAKQDCIEVATLCEHTRAISNALTNSNQFYDNADLTEDFTYRKNYAFTYASAAKAAVYKITN